MLGLDKKSLLFPKLVYLRDGVLVKESQIKFASNPPPTDPRLIKLSKQMAKPERTPVRLYRLDWTKMEEIKQQRQRDRINGLIKDGGIPDQPTAALKSLPESYAANMNAMVFAVPDNYMKAINHCCIMAQSEWEHPYPFDTIIREGCYEPAAAFVKVAFHLLADCIYDESKQYYGREWTTKQVFEQTALVRYWMHQVGSWIAMDNAGLKINYGNGPKIKNTAVTYMFDMAQDGINAPDAMATMMMDMLDFYEFIEAATPRPRVAVAEMPTSKITTMPAGAPVRRNRKK